MKILVPMVLISLLSFNVFAFDSNTSDFVKLQSDLGQLDIQATAHSSGTLTYVIVKNDSMEKVSCEATFRNGPELPKLGLSKAEIEPASTAYLKYVPKRSAVVIKANLKCSAS